MAATFLTPPLNFDQSDHTRPSLRHHWSIYVDRFGYGAANSGEISHRRRRSSLAASSVMGNSTYFPTPASARMLLPSGPHMFSTQRFVWKSLGNRGRNSPRQNESPKCHPSCFLHRFPKKSRLNLPPFQLREEWRKDDWSQWLSDDDYDIWYIVLIHPHFCIVVVEFEQIFCPWSFPSRLTRIRDFNSDRQEW